MNALHVFLALLAPVLAAVAGAAEKPKPDKPKTDRAPIITAPERTEKQKTSQQLHDEGLAAFKAGNLQAAKFAFEKVLSLSPENPAALVNLALLEQRKQHHAEAERLLRRLLRDEPGNATAWLILGTGAYEQGRLDAALAHFAQAVLYAPKDARSHHYLGLTLGRRGWYGAAEEELRAAIQHDPKFADAHYNLATLYIQRIPPATELARRHYQKAMELGTPPDEKLAGKIGD